MKSNTKKALGLGLIGVSVLSMGALAVSAYDEEGRSGKVPFGNSEEIKDAITNNDYETFSELTDKDISEDQFDMIVARAQTKIEVKNAIDAEDYDAFAQALEDSPRGVPSVDQFDEMVLRHQAHEKAEAAIEAGNYDLWVSAVQDLPHAQDMADLISEDEFSILMELHEAKEAGDRETVKELADELGLEKPQKHGRGHGKGAGMKFSR